MQNDSQEQGAEALTEEVIQEDLGASSDPWHQHGFAIRCTMDSRVLIQDWIISVGFRLFAWLELLRLLMLSDSWIQIEVRF